MIVPPGYVFFFVASEFLDCDYLTWAQAQWFFLRSREVFFVSLAREQTQKVLQAADASWGAVKMDSKRQLSDEQVTLWETKVK